MLTHPFSASLVLAALVQPVFAAAGLHYHLDFSEREQHFVHVEMSVPATKETELQILMPVWTPGSYLIREYARHVDHLTATDPDGTQLGITRTSRDRWTIDTQGKDRPVRIHYRLYCRELSVRTNWVDAQMAILNGAATFLTVPEFRNRPHRLTADLPDGWQVATALEQHKDSWVSGSYEQLVDSPVIAAPLHVSDFEQGGRSHRLVHFGDATLWNTSKAASDVQKIVRAHQKFWGHTPYPHYTFLNAIVESRGGLEHDNSTLVMTGRFAFRDPKRYEDWLSLISHEFFHTWNVRRLRPVELRNYDLQHENYTRSLWVAEGITSYYEDLLLVRAGVLKRSNWLKRLSKSIEKLQSGPGRLHQSLSDASYDTWIKFYRPHENSRNIHVSYYTKGAVVAFLLDARIRELSNNTKSLDDVMQTLYRGFHQTGYSPDNFRQTCCDVAGHDLSDWLDEHVNQAHELNYEPALQWYGLTFAKPEAPQSDTASEPQEQDNKDEKKIWLGVELESDLANCVVSRVRADGPAAGAGLNVGDELIAINDIRCTTAEFEDQLQQYAPGETMQLLISRRGRLLTLELPAVHEPDEKWALHVVSEPSGPQKSSLESLLRP